MRKILVVNRLGIGDVVATTPLAKLLKEKAAARVGFAVAQKSEDLLINHPYIDDAFGYCKKNKAETIEAIRLSGYDEAIIADGRFSSTMLARRAGCKLLNRGYEISIGANRLFKRKENEPRAMEDYTAYIRLVCPELTSYPISPVLGSPDPGRMYYIEHWLRAQEKRSKQLVLMIPKSAALNKNWPPSYFGELNRCLNEKGIRPAYIGAKSDKDYIEAIPGEKINAAGQFSLRELPAVARAARFAVSVCTGPLHIISTANLPVVALYGPSDDARWAPPNAIVLKSGIACAPCNRLDCKKAEAKTCMEQIDPRRVMEVIESRGWV